LLILPLTGFEGEIAALSAACLWAIASVVYGRLGERIPPLQLNLIKGIVAIAFLLLTIFISGELFPSIAPVPLSLILLSGVVGIGLGDTVFFASINTLGPRRALLMGTLAPPMTAIAAVIFLQERLNISAWCGILLTILGVAWVVTERTPDTSSNFTTHLWQGIGWGVLAAMANAIGAVFSRAAFTHTSISPLWAALLRLSAGVLILIIWVSLDFLQKLGKEQRDRVTGYWQSSRVILAIFFAAFCGTYLGIWLQQVALKLTTAGVASTLLQTSPVFIIPIAIWLREKVTWRAIAGVIMAIAGIGMLFYLK
jgi:drug/metabolite transporter (DMT)-like permease